MVVGIMIGSAFFGSGFRNGVLVEDMKSPSWRLSDYLATMFLRLMVQS